MIHVSDLLQYEKCPDLVWNRNHYPIPFESLFHMDLPYHKLWMKYLDIENAISGKTGDDNQRSLSLLQENDVLVQGRFSYKDCRTRIPVLKKIENGYIAIYPYLNAFPKEKEARLMKINTMILEKLGISITENRILYLNKDYIRKDALDLNELFLLSDKLHNRRNHLNLTIQECMDKEEIDLDDLIEKTKEVQTSDIKIPCQRSKKCTSPRRCMYYTTCFDESKEADDSVLFLTTSSNKLKAYEKGIVHLKDLPISEMEGFRLQYAQYMASKNKGFFMDYCAVHAWLSQIQYPISYLDFEWDTFAIPPYRGLKPFDVICFQYSLHIETKDGKLSHTDFFDYGDCREGFIQSLIQSVPKEGSILVYNMEGAEKLRLKQLSEQFPQYKENLKQIYDRMIDLSKPFECGLFYDNRMRGHYSLKNVMPVFTDDYSYYDLSINDGLQAVKAYRIFENADEEQRNHLRNNIRLYCKMDTFAEYIVYHGLLKLDQEELKCQI